MKKSISYLFFILYSSFLLLGQTSNEILRKVREKSFGITNQAVVTMTITRPDWTRTLSIKSWSKGENFSVVLITDPAKEKGTVFLKRNNEMWNWIPSVERTIKLPPSVMSQSWMGSDFTNDDLIHESSLENDFNSLIEKEETIGGYECWKIVLSPKEEANILWGKIITWVSKKDHNQLKTEFYDEELDLVNTLNATNIRNFGGRMVPGHIEMTPAGKPGNKTAIDYSSIIYDQPIDEIFFTIQNIKNIH